MVEGGKIAKPLERAEEDKETSDSAYFFVKDFSVNAQMKSEAA